MKCNTIHRGGKSVELGVRKARIAFELCCFETVQYSVCHLIYENIVFVGIREDDDICLSELPWEFIHTSYLLYALG